MNRKIEATKKKDRAHVAPHLSPVGNGIFSKLSAGPYLLWMIIFVLGPLALVIWSAFTYVGEDGSVGGFTTDYVVGVVQYLPITALSIGLAIIATIICLVMAFPFAYAISRMSGANQKFMVMLIMLPMWMNFLLRTYAWSTIFSWMPWLNNTAAAVVIGMVYNYLPFMILPLYSVMTKIDNRIVEAAQDLGANWFKILTKVLIPLSMPGITSGITMVFVPAVSTFMISSMLGGKMYLIGNVIDEQFNVFYNPNFGSAIALVLMIIVLFFMFLFNQFDEDNDSSLLL